MAIVEDAKVHECDACGSHRIQVEGDGPPNGFHGTVLEVSDTGGMSAKWYACKEGCIRKAVTNALMREYQG